MEAAIIEHQILRPLQAGSCSRLAAIITRIYRVGYCKEDFEDLRGRTFNIFLAIFRRHSCRTKALLTTRAVLQQFVMKKLYTTAGIASSEPAPTPAVSISKVF